MRAAKFSCAHPTGRADSERIDTANAIDIGAILTNELVSTVAMGFASLDPSLAVVLLTDERDVSRRALRPRAMIVLEGNPAARGLFRMAHLREAGPRPRDRFCEWPASPWRAPP